VRRAQQQRLAARQSDLKLLMQPHSPVLSFPPQLLLLAQPVKVAFFDVDGVLTDGGLYFGELPQGDARATPQPGFNAAGETLKRFNSLDGHGLKLLQRAGITPAVITGRDSAVLRARLQALGVVHAHFGTEDKRPAAESTLQALGLDWSQAAFMGDDWPDLPVMRRVAFSCAPANAHAEVKALATYVTQARGGDGAVREFCDLLLVASGRYAGLLQAYTC
jgi:3-deoxy-D-manno-octulosonate 8-phosphate phosphatase (KDO 8-P phosphatase)